MLNCKVDLSVVLLTSNVYETALSLAPGRWESKDGISQRSRVGIRSLRV